MGNIPTKEKRLENKKRRKGILSALLHDPFQVRNFFHLKIFKALNEIHVLK